MADAGLCLNVEGNMLKVSYSLDLLFFLIMTLQLCDVSVTVDVDAELVDDVERTEDTIVSHWRNVSCDERHQMREHFDEILRPLGFKTSLVVIRRAN